MNRVVFSLDSRGNLTGVCADQPVEIYINCPDVPADRVYLYESVQIGPQHVRKAIGGFSVGRAADGTKGLAEADGRGRLPPSKPSLGVVKP